MQALGTIVYLKDGRAKIMIINRGPIVEKEGISFLYDYAGCVYPIGMNPEQVLYFNEENIDKVLFEGYRDEDEQRFEELYKKSVEDLGDSVMKGLPNLNLKS
ncbi:hypothetical protein A5881_003236 [Enterococcus termitis]|nr:hypothetical protein A5881_003615 [Enterococcus termitis]